MPKTTRQTTRSAVSSGRKMFAMGSGHTVWGRRFSDVVAGHVSDLGGYSELSAAQESLIKRVATIEVELEAMEGKLSVGEPVDLDRYTRAAGHLRRILETLGIERRAKPVQSLDDYLASKRPEAEAERIRQQSREYAERMKCATSRTCEKEQST